MNDIFDMQNLFPELVLGLGLALLFGNAFAWWKHRRGEAPQGVEGAAYRGGRERPDSISYKVRRDAESNFGTFSRFIAIGTSLYFQSKIRLCSDLRFSRCIGLVLLTCLGLVGCSPACLPLMEMEMKASTRRSLRVY